MSALVSAGPILAVAVLGALVGYGLHYAITRPELKALRTEAAKAEQLAEEAGKVPVLAANNAHLAHSVFELRKENAEYRANALALRDAISLLERELIDAQPPF